MRPDARIEHLPPSPVGRDALMRPDASIEYLPPISRRAGRPHAARREDRTSAAISRRAGRPHAARREDRTAAAISRRAGCPHPAASSDGFSQYAINDEGSVPGDTARNRPFCTPCALSGSRGFRSRGRRSCGPRRGRGGCTSRPDRNRACLRCRPAPPRQHRPARRRTA